MEQQTLKLALNILEGIERQAGALIEILSAGIECKHPVDARTDMSTMNNISWKCSLCGFIWDEKEQGEGGVIDG